jgi:hypothetical protein
MDFTRKQLTNVAKAGWHQRADEYVRQCPRIPGGNHEGCGSAELRHPLFQRLARPDQRADDRIGPRYAGALLPAADARHVDRCFRLTGLAHNRNPGRRLCRGAAGSSGSIPANVVSIDAPTPYVWIISRTKTDGPARLRGRAQDPGRLQGHADLALWSGRRAGGRHRRSRCRHEDPAKDPGRHDAGRQVLRLRRRDPEGAAAAHHRRADPRADAAISTSSIGRSKPRSRPRPRTPWP